MPPSSPPPSAPAPTPTTTATPSRAHHLATTHLLSVFSAPSPTTTTNSTDTTVTDTTSTTTSRRFHYTDLYTPDVTIYENDGNALHGHDGVEELVGRLVGRGGTFDGWAFVVAGEVMMTRDVVLVGWGFGPRREKGEGEGGEVEVRVTGKDVLMLAVGEDGVCRVKAVYVLVDGLSDV